jgi:hypothetical protein
MNLLSDYMKKIPFKTLALVSAITAAMPAQAITIDELAQQFEALLK